MQAIRLSLCVNVKPEYREIFYCCSLFFFPFSLFAQAPELIVPAGHGDQVYLTKFSADGKFLFSVGTGAKAVKIWDTKTGVC